MLTDKERADLAKGKPAWKIFLIAFSFLIGMGPILLGNFYKIAKRKAIRQDRSFATATITRLEYEARKGRDWYTAYATYQVGGTSFMAEGKAFETLTPEQRTSLIGRRLPVIYEKTDPSNGALLVSERQFNRFNLDRPDSLAWTRLYFFD